MMFFLYVSVVKLTVVDSQSQTTVSFGYHEIVDTSIDVLYNHNVQG